jgi:hypothetical protein
MRSEKKNPWQKARPTTWPLSIDVEPDQDQTKPADQAEEITTPDEEDTKEDTVEVPAIPEAETTITEMANTATFANFRATDRKNAGKG